jgi:cytochrome P450
MDECAAQHGHVFTLRLMVGAPSVWIADPEYLRELWSNDREHRLSSGRKFLLEPALGPRSVLLQVGAEHLWRRRLMLPPFHGERMRGYARVIEEMTARDIERWPVGKPFPLLERMQRITLDVILRAVFGTAEGPREDALRERLRDLLAQSTQPWRQLALGIDWYAGGRIAPFGGAVRRVDELIAEELAERRAAGDLEEREDILSLLMLARDEDGEGLGDAELRDQLMTLLLAGHETTATGLAWAFDALFRNESALDRLRRELASGDGDAYLSAVVDETLRVRPVVPEVGRRLGAPLAMNGYELPAGTDVFASVQLAHRRADLFPDPRAFRPERFLDDKPSTYSWIPFGGGTRRCLGAAFAQLEMRRVLATVIERADLEPATDGPEPVERRPVTIAPRNGTPAVLAGVRAA